jgi:hypothetical protein
LIRGLLEPEAKDLPSFSLSLGVTIASALLLWLAATMAASKQRSGAPK